MTGKNGDEDFAALFEASAANQLQIEVKNDKDSSIPAENRRQLTERRLKKIRIEIQDTLDLHGSNKNVAKLRTKAFIQRSRAQKKPAVRVITGKGNNSENGPVLQPVIESLLEEFRNKRQIVRFILENSGGSYIVQLGEYYHG